MCRHKIIRIGIATIEQAGDYVKEHWHNYKAGPGVIQIDFHCAIYVTLATIPIKDSFHRGNPCKIGVTMRDGLPPLRPYAKEPSLYLGEVSHLRFLSSNAPVSLALHKGVVGSIAKRDAATLGTWAERLHREFLCAIHTALGGHVLPGNRTGNAWPIGPSAFACSKGWDVLHPCLVGLGSHQRAANPYQRVAVYAYLRIACCKSATHVCAVYDNLLHIYIVTFRI